MQAATASSSNADDDDDDTPLAMLPASRARHTAPSADHTPAGPVRQLPQLTHPACSDTPAALPASSLTRHEQSDTCAAWQSMQVKAPWVPSMQGATDVPALTPHTGIAGPLDAADTEAAAGVPQATALPPAGTRQEVHSSPAGVEEDMAQDRHDPQQPAVSMQEVQTTVASGLQAVPDIRGFPAADAGDTALPSDHQDHLVSDSELEGLPSLSSQVLASLAEGVLGSVITNMASPVQRSPMTLLKADSNAATSTSPRQSQQQPQQQQANESPKADAVFPVANSSQSLLQAEAEAARLAVLLVPPVYHPPALAEQLAQMGTGLHLQTTGTASIHASLHAQAGSLQASSMKVDEATLVNEQSCARNIGTAETELPGTVQHLHAAGEVPTSLGPALSRGPSMQGSLQQQNAKVAAVSGLQELAMQVHEQRLKECGDAEVAKERPAASSEQEHPVFHAEDAADLVIPDR